MSPELALVLRAALLFALVTGLEYFAKRRRARRAKQWTVVLGSAHPTLTSVIALRATKDTRFLEGATGEPRGENHV